MFDILLIQSTGFNYRLNQLSTNFFPLTNSS